MNKRDLLSMSVRNLWRRKLRTSLTLLGVLIGTTSIIVMISLGLGLNRTTVQSMERMGSLTSINVSGSSMFGGMKARSTELASTSSTTKEVYLNDAAVDLFKLIPGVIASEPILRAQFGSPLKFGRYSFYPQYVGVKQSFFESFDIKATEGVAPSMKSKTRPQIYLPSNIGLYIMMSQGENAGISPETLPDIDYLNARLTLDFIRWDQNTGKEIIAKSLRLKPVGMYENSGWESNVYMLMDDVVFLNNEYEKFNNEQNGAVAGNAAVSSKNRDIYSEIRVKVVDVSKVAEVKAAIEAQGYYGSSMMDVVNEMNTQMATIQAVLAGIGSVALLVAAIGITNTMVMSIYERTREIGVMKVIGASVANIRKIFLTEAIMIGTIGGTLGVGLSMVISQIINAILGPQLSGFSMGMPGEGPAPEISYIPAWLIALAVIFSGVIGLIAGYYPAKRATKLSAIEAIKTE